MDLFASRTLSPSHHTDDGSHLDSDDSAKSRTSVRKQRMLAPNLTRKSHTKSRLGCRTCKARKVKCDEIKPICTQCSVKQLMCSYQASTSDRALARSTPSSRQLSNSPASAQLSLNDMSFFHHFLTASLPHLPLGNKTTWTRDIPQIAHHHPFLMHAILAFGASHLTCMTSAANYRNEALTHRGHAIRGLNACMAKTEHAIGEADAMLATCYALTFQSSHIADGLADFIVFVRGCALTTKTILEGGMASAFHLAPDLRMELVRPRLHGVPILSLEHVTDGITALERLESYLQNTAEVNFYNSLHRVLCGLEQSSQIGYLEFIEIYQVWYDLENRDLTVFLDPTNAIMQILFGFFIGIQLLVAPLLDHEEPFRSARDDSQIILGLDDWLSSVTKNVPPKLQYHLLWSRGIMDIVKAELVGKHYESSPVFFVRRWSSDTTSQDVEMEFDTIVDSDV